ncbi:hypothetical protein C8J57DRAFT_1235751 [Mycena rebaudengoi]|nr:hypothetical protein C8J57DRAFT_1235751 [Mycena rebaudengoi]
MYGFAPGNQGQFPAIPAGSLIHTRHNASAKNKSLTCPLFTFLWDLSYEERPEASGIKIEQMEWSLPLPPIENGELLDDFGNHFDELGILESEADEETGLICTCGSGMERNTKCYDCTEYAAACKMCFVAAHFRNPFHWAEVWDNETGFFVRHDISKLDHVFQLGHNGGPCKSPTGERLFAVVDGNGIHSTRLAFCGCREMPPNKIRQLMRARLFPATTKDPHTAFTVNMLKEFQLHNLKSKKAAYDHLGAIRCLSDNSFTADISRSGQFHSIDTILFHRPPGNLLVWCPACPEPGFNSDPNCPKTPPHLRHAYERNAYFPLDSKYQDYLKSVPVSTKVVNKQDKKKFKNMAITGTVNCQCSHVFILSSVDLPHAERFANSDYALAMAIRNHKPTDDFTFKLQFEINDVDEAATYDIACANIVNLENRFEKHFPDQLENIKMQWGVPALHVQGHQDSCTYLFGTAYMECDTIINHHGDWNHKKTMKIASDLAEDLQTAKKKYLEKRNHYIGLSISFKDRLRLSFGHPGCGIRG